MGGVSAVSGSGPVGVQMVAQMAVLRQALDIQKQTAQLLIQAITPPPATASNPAGLGNTIDTFA